MRGNNPVELEKAQRYIAERLGVRWDRYQARAKTGVYLAAPLERPRPFSLRWFGLPRLKREPGGLSALRYDRSLYPRMVFLTEEDRAVAPGLEGCIDSAGNYGCKGTRVDEGERAKIRYDSCCEDVVRMSVCVFGRRFVVALYALRSAWRGTRFGLDVVWQRGDGHWGDRCLRLYRRPKSSV